MHRKLVNYCMIDLTLKIETPLLIKSGKTSADPTKPDMEFVETYYQGRRTVYLPGSSLKGAIRAHAERIVRTVGRDNRNDNHQLWASNPTRDKFDYLKNKDGFDAYKLSSFTDRLFGHPYLASHFRIEDAYPIDLGSITLEERSGVAIDRVSGAVAVGPFNYQVCTSGEFRTRIHLKNFYLAQLGLLGLVLRDLDEGWFALGFAKSRGLGMVSVHYNKATVQYPACVLDESEEKKILMKGKYQKEWDTTMLLGAGEFLEQEEASRYGFPLPDRTETPVTGRLMELGFGVELSWEQDTATDLFMRCVKCWRQMLGT
ncbi:MAG: RAMP superfamily CRISPR-associated protein [Pseudanabaenaceae cyanobacterium]